MSERLPISVIMVSYHTGEVLLEAINGVLATPIAELILVNNGNPEADFERVRERLNTDSRCQLIEGQGNVGYAAASNLGATRATQEKVLFLNPDAIVNADAIARLYHEHVSLLQPALSGAWVVDDDGNVQRGTLRNKLTPLSLVVDALKLNVRWTFFDRWALNRRFIGSTDVPVQVSALSGACLLMPRAVFEQAKGFDEGYFLHFEDLDLFKRLTCEKYLHPSVRILHHKGSSDVDKTTLNAHKYQSFCRYFRRHYPIFWYSPAGWALNGVFRFRRHRFFSR